MAITANDKPVGYTPTAKTTTPQKTETTKTTNKTFSSYDNNKNANIELADADTKNLINSCFDIQDTKDANLSAKLGSKNAKTVFTQSMNSVFKAFQYDTSKTSSQINSETKSKIQQQGQAINKHATTAYGKLLENAKAAIEKDFQNYLPQQYEKFRTTYNNARASFYDHKKSDGWAAKSAELIGRIYDSKNTYAKIERMLIDFKSVLTPLGNIVKNKEINKFNTAKIHINTLKGHGDIEKKVKEFNDSQDTGATAVKVGAAVAVGVATGGVGTAATMAIGAVSAGAIEFVDKASSEKGIDDNTLKDVAIATATGAIPIKGAGKLIGKGIQAATNAIVGQGTQAAVKTTVSKVINTGIAKFGKATLNTGIKYVQQYGEKTAVKMLQKTMGGTAEELVRFIGTNGLTTIIS